ncbi:MAG: antibiotic biosynthesis monooxygenase [Ilumatobacteraceae bacterium]|nr:antibiotic biosynthesis monooxygenase [Ilumatobacteraceae bacterium]
MSVPLSGPFDTGQLPRIAAHPVTVTVARTVAPGWEAEFLKWADELIAAAREFPGCLGAAVLHPGADGGEYQIIVRFSDGLMLRVWERSAIRNELMERADKFVTGTRMSRTVGVEEWFNAAGNAEPKRPMWKKLSFEVAWVYPAALLITLVAAPLLVKIPLGIRVLTSIAVVTVVMQFIVLPIRKRLRAKRRF